MDGDPADLVEGAVVAVLAFAAISLPPDFVLLFHFFMCTLLFMGIMDSFLDGGI